jgi:hypothetical protein
MVFENGNDYLFTGWVVLMIAIFILSKSQEMTDSLSLWLTITFVASLLLYNVFYKRMIQKAWKKTLR